MIISKKRKSIYVDTSSVTQQSIALFLEYQQKYIKNDKRIDKWINVVLIIFRKNRSIITIP